MWASQGVLMVLGELRVCAERAPVTAPIDDDLPKQLRGGKLCSGCDVE